MGQRIDRFCEELRLKPSSIDSGFDSLQVKIDAGAQHAEAAVRSHLREGAGPNRTRPECYRVLGHDPAEGLPSFARLVEDVHHEDRPQRMENFDKAVRARGDWQADYRLVILEYVGTVLDITEQKRADEERRAHLWFLESMDRINRAMQRSNDVEDVMSDVLEETLAIFGSDRAWLVYPCAPDAATSRVVMEHTRPEYAGAFALGEEFPVDRPAAEILRRVLGGRGAVTDLSVPPEIRERFSIQSMTAIAVRPKGDRRYLFELHQCSHACAWTAAERRLFEEIAQRLEDALTRVFAHRNLLAREEELRRCQHCLAEAQKLTHIGSWALNAAGFGHWSPEMFKIHGLDLDGKAPSIPEYLGLVHPEDRDFVAKEIEQVLAGAEGFDFKKRIVRPDGAIRHVRCVGIRATTGGIVQEFVGTGMDVTDQERAEAERERLEERLRQAEKMEAIGNLAGGIAHDFNNVLAGIFAYGDMLLEETPEGSPHRRYVRNVLAAATRGRDLVDQILTYSRSQHGRRAPVDLATIVAEALELVRGSLPSAIHLEVSTPGLPLVVIGNATRLHEVVMNLCRNAIQAMSAGGTLRVMLETTEVSAERPLSHGTLAPGRYVCLTVEDSGSGMDQATLSRIFEPFFTTKGIGQGTGLGLALVYAILTDKGGAIDVKSAPEQGSIFTIYLPHSEAALAAADAAAPPPRGHGERVLLVDDEAPVLAGTAEVLLRLGYEPMSFSDSRAALAAFETAPGRFDVAITDEGMLGLSGTGLATALRRHRPDLPIVLLSGYRGPLLTQQAVAAGVSEVLTKPLQSREMATMLARVLRRTA